MNPKTNRCARVFLKLFAIAASAFSLVDLSAHELPEIKLSSVLHPFVESHTLSGAVVLVADPHEVLDVEAVGSMDIAAEKPMRADCMFWIASQSKPITATALMILVDEGKVSVDDPVEKYLPEFIGQQVNVSSDAAKPELRAPRHPILVCEILSHTSGLPFKSDIEEPTLDLKSLAERVQSYAKMSLLFEPGTQSKYSNAGINTAGRIVEVVSGMSFETFLDERIFKPLGMRDTTFFPSKSQIERLAKAYKPNATKNDLEECEITQLKYPLDDPERQSMPAGGLFSTANDVSIFYRMIANDGIFNGTRILSEKSVQQMTSDQSGEARSSYGFGFGTNGRVITHGGAYNSMSRFDREHRLITIFLGQHSGWMNNGKTIIPAFQKAATDAFGSRNSTGLDVADTLHSVGIPQNPMKPDAGTNAKNQAITNSIGMKLVPIAAGSFEMGQNGPAADYKVKEHAAKFDDADWDEGPAHKVTISTAFHIGMTEVTLGEFRQFRPKHSGGRGAADDAVTGVSWNDAMSFCEWLSNKENRTYRLPTEAEWEYACRAGTTTLFHTGDALPAGFHQWPTDIGLRDRFFPDDLLPPEYRPKNVKLSLRVAQSPANAWGVFDMHGNVSEWCEDWYGPYQAIEQSDPLGRSDGDFRLTRGGSHSTQTRLLRSANRTAWLPQTTSEKTGFRVVLGELPRGTMLPPAPQPLNTRNVSQTAPNRELPTQDAPFFDGPKPFVIIPPQSSGPLFSWHNHSPTIAECPNGDLLAVWYSCVDEAGTELNNLASRLRPCATEWEPASLFWDGPDINDHAPKLWWDGDKTLFHFARGQFEDIVRTSKDNGVTWTKAQAFQPASEIGNGILRTREGVIMMTQDTTNTSLTVSRDGGKTWTSAPIANKKLAHRSGSPSRHAGIHAPIVELADGRLMTIGRLNTEEEQAKFDSKTPASYSNDGGLTWTHEPTPFPAISSVQRAVLMRLREGPLLLCSFTDLSANSKKPTGMDFPCEGGTLHGAGLFAAISSDEGRTWSHRRLITPGGEPRIVKGIDRGQFTLSDTSAEPQGYLAATQTRDGRVQLISSKNHYVFNLAWLKQLPAPPKKP